MIYCQSPCSYDCPGQQSCPHVRTFTYKLTGYGINPHLESPSLNTNILPCPSLCHPVCWSLSNCWVSYIWQYSANQLQCKVQNLQKMQDFIVGYWGATSIPCKCCRQIKICQLGPVTTKEDTGYSQRGNSWRHWWDPQTVLQKWPFFDCAVKVCMN